MQRHQFFLERIYRKSIPPVYIQIGQHKNSTSRFELMKCPEMPYKQPKKVS